MVREFSWTNSREDSRSGPTDRGREYKLLQNSAWTARPSVLY